MSEDQARLQSLTFRDVYSLHRDAGLSRRWSAVAALTLTPPAEEQTPKELWAEARVNPPRYVERVEERIEAFDDWFEHRMTIFCLWCLKEIENNLREGGLIE